MKMKIDILFTNTAWYEYLEWLEKDKIMYKKINELLKDIERNGTLHGKGKPEKLKYRKGYSRRIDEKNRLIYDIENDVIRVLSCKGHYEEKNSSWLNRNYFLILKYY